MSVAANHTHHSWVSERLRPLFLREVRIRRVVEAIVLMQTMKPRVDVAPIAHSLEWRGWSLRVAKLVKSFGLH